MRKELISELLYSCTVNTGHLYIRTKSICTNAKEGQVRRAGGKSNQMGKVDACIWVYHILRADYMLTYAGVCLCAIHFRKTLRKERNRDKIIMKID